MGQIFNKTDDYFKDPSKSSIVRHELKVGTLNYCGVAYSPFEFYFCDQQKQLEEISAIFKKLVSTYVPNFNEKSFKWEMGKIDKTFKKGRYSPMFYIDVGMFWKTFLNRQQFNDKWEEQFNKNVATFKFEWTTVEKQIVRLYDFIMYHTLLTFVYKTDKFQEAIKNDTDKYFKVLKPFYEISFLDEESKLNKFMENYDKHQFDILFIQEYSALLLKELRKRPNLFIQNDPREDSLVVLNIDCFDKIDPFEDIKKIINEEQEKYFRWAQSVVFVGADNYIIICAHLSSKQDKNKSQVENLRKDLQLLHKNLPKYQIILGGDLNSYVQELKPFNSFPNESKQFTTLKKRTSTQAQFNKAEKQVKQSKDKIFTTLPILKGSISFFNGDKANDSSYIPSHDHPFDHFLIEANLRV